MKKRKVCIVITTRGNYAKMESVMEHISRHRNLELQVIIGGGVILPRYGSIIELLDAKEFKIDRIIHFLLEGENPITMAKSAGLALGEFTTAFENLKPDIVMAIADRFEALPIAMAAGYMNITVAHLEGGEVSGSIDESVRHAITKLSHIHFPATAEAAERIKKLGEEERSIFVVGSPSIDRLTQIDFSDRSDLNSVHQTQDMRGVGPVLDLHKPYLVVSQHPVTTEYEENLRHINETINAIDSLGINTFWIWPNMDAGSDAVSKGIRMYRERRNPPFVHFFKSLRFDLYARLINHAECLVGNSSSGIREASFLGIPVVNIGTRQQGRARGENVIDVDYNVKEIAAGIKKQMAHGKYPRRIIYGDGNAGKKITEVLATYNCPIQKKITY